jgi:tRNA(Ile)-lysidine synthase
MQSTEKLPAVERAVREYFAGPTVSPRHSILLVAFSGGPDSTALALALARQAPVVAFRVELAYLDHGLRHAAERERELSWVRERAAAWGLPIHVERIPEGQVRRTAQMESRSEEDVCREVRYRFLHRVADAAGASCIAVAHTQDDQHETILMRVLQGSGPGGLSGIPERSGMVVRPLLRITREQIRSYLQARGEQYVVDSTNSDESYLRNRMRRRIMPVLRDVFPGFEPGLATLSQKMAEVHCHLERQAEALFVQTNGPNAGIAVERYVAADRAVRTQAAYLLANRSGATSGRLPHRFILAVVGLTSEKASRGGLVAAGHGVEFRVSDGLLVARRRIVRPEEKGYLVVAIPEREYRLGNLLRFRVYQQEDPVGDEQAVRVPAHAVQPPFCVRSRRIGDTLPAREGRKSVKKLFNDWNVPPYLRTIIPLCEDRNGVFAVWGRPFGFPNRLATDRGRPENDKASGAMLVFEWME